MNHVRGAPYHQRTQGKIKRWHQTLKNRILLENYCLPGDLCQQIDAFVEHYNHRRYHESLQKLTPADVHFGRGNAVLKQRERIKQKTIETRRLLHRRSAAYSSQPDEQSPLLVQVPSVPKSLTTDKSDDHPVHAAGVYSKNDRPSMPTPDLFRRLWIRRRVNLLALAMVQTVIKCAI